MYVPIPSEEDLELDAFDDEVSEELKILGYMEGHEDFAQPPEVPMFVRVDSFNASSIDIMVYCFTSMLDWGEFLAAKERFALEVKEIVEGAGTSFAFPSQSLYIESLPGETAELFIPPAK